MGSLQGGEGQRSGFSPTLPTSHPRNRLKLPLNNYKMIRHTSRLARVRQPAALWPVSDRATRPTEGLPYRGRPSVGGFGGVRDPRRAAGSETRAEQCDPRRAVRPAPSSATRAGQCDGYLLADAQQKPPRKPTTLPDCCRTGGSLIFERGGSGESYGQAGHPLAQSAGCVQLGLADARIQRTGHRGRPGFTPHTGGLRVVI